MCVCVFVWREVVVSSCLKEPEVKSSSHETLMLYCILVASFKGARQRDSRPVLSHHTACLERSAVCPNHPDVWKSTEHDEWVWGCLSSAAGRCWQASHKSGLIEASPTNVRDLLCTSIYSRKEARQELFVFSLSRFYLISSKKGNQRTLTCMFFVDIGIHLIWLIHGWWRCRRDSHRTHILVAHPVTSIPLIDHGKKM